MTEARQGLIGGAAWLIATVVGAVLIAALAGDVPAWTLALALVLAPLVAYWRVSQERQEVGRLEGLLEGAEARRREAEAGREKAEERLQEAEAKLRSQPVDPPMGGIQSGFLFRIQSLRREANLLIQSRNFATEAQSEALRNLALDMTERFGDSRTLEAISERAYAAPDYELSDLITALGQMEGLLIEQTEPGAASHWRSSPSQ